jgi:hypothetical protein
MELDYLPLISPVGVSTFVTSYHGCGAQPPRRGNSRPAGLAGFYRDYGFGQTDYMHLHFAPDPADPGQGLHFLHCNNPRHHSLALFQDLDPHPGELVHLMVEVPDLDTLGRMMDQVHSEQVRVISASDVTPTIAWFRFVKRRRASPSNTVSTGSDRLEKLSAHHERTVLGPPLGAGLKFPGNSPAAIDTDFRKRSRC